MSSWNTYLTMVRDSLLLADLILFCASRCVIPSVLTPSMAEMMSPWARLPLTALLPGVIYRRRESGEKKGAGYTRNTDTHSSGITQVKKHIRLHKHVHTDGSDRTGGVAPRFSSANEP